MKITWSEQARGDLRAIRNFIARDSEHYARLQIGRLISRVERTAGMPSKGHPVHELNPRERGRPARIVKERGRLAHFFFVDNPSMKMWAGRPLSLIHLSNALNSPAD